MAQWIKKHLEDSYDRVVYVFANTGLENEQTLEFVQQCDDYWKLNVQWVEASVNFEKGVGTGYWLTDFDNAKRKGEPFEAMIKKYGIPNQSAPSCTRSLKQVPIEKFANDWFDGEKYETAIGIRIDEIDRMSESAKKRRLIYPLIRKDMIPVTKPMINFFWKQMDFRLNLKGYQGNCITCWKKSDKKLFQIYKENPKAFNFMDRMERKYPRVGAEFEKDISAKDRTFFRNHRSANDIMIEADKWNGIVRNDAEQYSIQLDLFEGESCDVFSNCGDD